MTLSANTSVSKRILTDSINWISLRIDASHQGRSQEIKSLGITKGGEILLPSKVQFLCSKNSPIIDCVLIIF